MHPTCHCLVDHQGWTLEEGARKGYVVVNCSLIRKRYSDSDSDWHHKFKNLSRTSAQKPWSQAWQCRPRTPICPSGPRSSPSYDIYIWDVWWQKWWLVGEQLAHRCTIFLKSSGYRNIDDRHRNPNINIREIIWLGNQLVNNWNAGEWKSEIFVNHTKIKMMMTICWFNENWMRNTTWNVDEWKIKRNKINGLRKKNTWNVGEW